MMLRDFIRAGESRSMLVRRPATELLHGAVRATDEKGGWSRPWRFSADQMRALGSCQAWHPGLYRQMARATSGICLEFETDSSEVAIEVLLDAEPSGTSSVLDYVGEGAHDGVSADVDGRHLEVRLPEQGDDFVVFTLDDPDAAPADGIMQLPGMGDTHHVRVWLPCLRGCCVRHVVGNGCVIEPVAEREHLLVLGDSIAQGFVAGDPGLTWPVLLAQRMGLDLVNQGVGGQVFQPGSLFGLARAVRPRHIVVELGENYRYEPCRERLVSRDIRAYLGEVARIWPDVPTHVLTPIWHNEAAYRSHAMSCFAQVPGLIATHVAAFGHMQLVDGATLMDEKSLLMADGYEHPNAEGSAQIADRLHAHLTARTGDATERRSRALEALRDAHRRTLPLAEAIRRGLGEVVYAERGCVLLELPGDMMVLWASDLELGRAVIATLVTARKVMVLEPALVRDLELMRGLTGVSPCHLAIYDKRTPPADPFAKDPSKTIRALDATFFSTVLSHYAHPEFLAEGELEGLLERGGVLGGFDGDELVGFIGEHPQGSMGMLEVFPGHRRQGWAQALETALIARTMAQGHKPFCEVLPDNKASLKLQRKLGFKVLAANELSFVFREEGGDDANADDANA